nr:AAA family ATPase [Bacteroides uniformis]
MEFSKGLNLIIGNGGKGKSKLFNAFYWVLFGKIYITGIGWCTTDNLPQSAKFAMQRSSLTNELYSMHKLTIKLEPQYKSKLRTIRIMII